MPEMPRARGALRAIALALAVTVAASLLRAGLFHVIGARRPYLTFFAGVIVAGLFGGLGAGVLALALAVVASQNWSTVNGAPASLAEADVIGILLFLTIGGAMVYVCDLARRA